MTDEVAAWLEDLRARNEAFGEGAADVPRLLAALDAVLVLTRDPVGDLPGECQLSVEAVREAISRALLGEVPTDG